MSMIGKTLGSFTLEALIGKGGMGEVYRAKDQKLGRDVAIKVLPEEFAKDNDRVARFQREAKLLASLNHPNIAAIHGLEESDGTHFLVLELIEGDTLADRLKHGAIPIEESLKLALQLAEALEAAHEKGVIHRDLKPANIKVTPDGKVKVLDFGLAKAFAGEQTEVNLSHSPTLSEAATLQGVILGTAAYMSPEQARGKPVDKRTDIWAFGCVLYEMLTGQAAFQGEDVTEILAAVVKSGVNLDLLPANIHPRIREVIIRCLQKEQKKRYRDIGEAQYEIEQVLSDPSGVFVQPVTTAKPRKKMRVGIPWLAITAIFSVIITGMAVWYLKPTEPKRVIYSGYELPKDQQFSDLLDTNIAVSPDGRQLAFCTSDGLYLRSMNEPEAKRILGTEENPERPFFSHDGNWIGYVSAKDEQLKKIPIIGGIPVPLTTAGVLGSLSWGADERIVYGGDSRLGIMRVSASGGTPEVIVKTENQNFIHPQILPDGRSVIFTDITSSPFKLKVQSLESGERRELLQGDTARYLPTGHLVYSVDNKILAVPYDVDEMQVIGNPIPLVEDVFRSGGAPQYAVSNSGTLVYIAGKSNAASGQRTLIWVDRNGKEEPIALQAKAYSNPKISPEGTRVALTVLADGNYDIWVWDLAHITLSRLTSQNDADTTPIWSPNGKQIVFASRRDENYGIFRKSADGIGEEENLTSAPNRLAIPNCLSNDGKTLLLTEWQGYPPRFDLSMFSVEDDRKKSMLLQEKHSEAQPRISPNGRWMAYVSDESGKNEVYVRPFPDVKKTRLLVSSGGGDSPLWSPDGRELFYRSGNAIMAAIVKTGPNFSFTERRILFEGNYVSYSARIWSQIENYPWDIHPDGKRFLMMKHIASTVDTSETEIPRKINVVLNWFEELKDRVPVE